MTTPFIKIQELLDLIGDYAGAWETNDPKCALRFHIKPNGKLARYIKIIYVPHQHTVSEKGLTPIVRTLLYKIHWWPIRKQRTELHRALMKVRQLINIVSEHTVWKRLTPHFKCDKYVEKIYENITQLQKDYDNDILNYALCNFATSRSVVGNYPEKELTKSFVNMPGSGAYYSQGTLVGGGNNPINDLEL